MDNAKVLKHAYKTFKGVIEAVLPDGADLETALELLKVSYRLARNGLEASEAEEEDLASRLDDINSALEDPIEGEDGPPRWQDRFVFDLNVSDTSPVVVGTWVTVSHIVSLIVDGWAWSDICRTHPELTESDIEAALAYSVEQEEGC